MRLLKCLVPTNPRVRRDLALPTSQLRVPVSRGGWAAGVDRRHACPAQVVGAQLDDREGEIEFGMTLEAGTFSRLVGWSAVSDDRGTGAGVLGGSPAREG